MELILIILLGVFLIISILEGFMIRGFLKTEKFNKNERARGLTGREIESIRRKLDSVGISSISHGDIANLIKTFQLITLGAYQDKDPFIPADPYEDV